MIQGTGSDAGKSLIVAGLARAFTQRGLRVRPFKPQNMSNNAAVAADGGEIGRAQALQARACGVSPSHHMNPILLKPEGEQRAQIVVQGNRWRSMSARDYHGVKPQLLAPCLESYQALSAQADLVLVEGAGSCAEINLREGDIANMGFAEAADIPVLLAGDIDRGGVIAQLVGTLDLLCEDERRRVKGLLINKFRGDPALFQSGIAAVEARTRKVVLGLIPWFNTLSQLPAEDALGIASSSAKPGAITVAVPLLPRIANFDDLDPLRLEPDVEVRMVRRGEALPVVDLVILPGSKATIADLAAFREAGWDIDLAAHARRGGWILGICGGYQMLGRTIADPQGIEGITETTEALGLLTIETVLGPQKHLGLVQGTACGAQFSGYEIHAGESRGEDAPFAHLADGRPDGGRRGRIIGTYVHGLFTDDLFRHAFLNEMRARTPSTLFYEERIEEVLDGWAAHLASVLDLDRVWEIANGR
ncbi:MAG TPA: cobyric acid synthase [Dongiaceae bacterium]|jgi:adenosylcobyric acid synthase|nr:cobyric acid synthase [Dongiaceae bacterium]